MTTSKQIAANRLNSQKSTGPKSPAGLQKVRQNAVWHGFYAQSLAVFPEEQESYEAFAQNLRDHYLPFDVEEELQFERIVSAAWRLKRIPHIETGILRSQTGKTNGSKQKEEAGEDSQLTLALAYQRNAGTLTRLSRQERALERTLREATDRLLQLQYARQTDCHPFFVQRMRRFPALKLGEAKQAHEGHYFNPNADATIAKKLAALESQPSLTLNASDEGDLYEPPTNALSAAEAPQTSCSAASDDSTDSETERCPITSSENPDLPSASQLAEHFSKLREAIGEVAYFEVLSQFGVHNPRQFKTLKESRDCYKRLLAIAKEQEAA